MLKKAYKLYSTTKKLIYLQKINNIVYTSFLIKKDDKKLIKN